MVRKRDINTLWELDPIAAPPRSVQQRLNGNAADATRDSSMDVINCGLPGLVPANTPDDRYGVLQETRSVLELQLKFAMREQDVDRVRLISRQLRSIEDSAESRATSRSQAASELLRVGDHCFALGRVVEWEWYRAKLIHVRRRSPPLQIEYLESLDGKSSRLALPVPTINHVPLEHVRLEVPEKSYEPITPPTRPCVTVPALAAF